MVLYHISVVRIIEPRSQHKDLKTLPFWERRYAKTHLRTGNEYNLFYTALAYNKAYSY